MFHPRTVQKIPASILLFAIFVLSMAVIPGTVVARGTLLVIHSTSRGDPWAERVAEGIGKELTGSHAEIDLKRYWAGADLDDSEERFEDIYEHLVRLAREYPISGVIGDGDAAFGLLRRYGRELFPGIPAAFCSVFDYRGFMWREYPYPGARATHAVRETFDRMLLLHPETKTVVAIVDDSPAGKKIREDAEKAFSRHMDRIQLVIPGYEVGREHELAKEDLLKIASAMPRNSLLLFGTFTRDNAGNPVNEPELTQAVIARSRVPVYVLSEAHFGTGAAGGLLMDATEHGRTAAGMILRQHAGTSPEDIGVITLPHRWEFDRQGLQLAETDYAQIVGRDGNAEELLPSPASMNWMRFILPVLFVAALSALALFLRRKKGR